MLISTPQERRKNENKTNGGENSTTMAIVQGTNVKMIPDEDFDKIFNHEAYAFKTVFEEFIKEPKVELIDKLHIILLSGGTHFQVKVQTTTCEILPYLENGEFYDKICLMLSDISHFNPKIVDSLLKSDIFSKLDYSKNISFPLVLSICDDNKTAWNIFKEKYLKPEFHENQYIKMLLNNK